MDDNIAQDASIDNKKADRFDSSSFAINDISNVVNIRISKNSGFFEILNSLLNIIIPFAEYKT